MDFFNLLKDPYIYTFAAFAMILFLMESFYSLKKVPQKSYFTELFYQVINYKYAGLLCDFIIIHTLTKLPLPSFELHFLNIHEWPDWGRFLVFLILIDFLEYLVHNLLHRVPWLWEFHKTHHAIPHLNWWSNLHFHPIEILIYKTFLYLPLLSLNPLFPEGWLYKLVMLRLAIGMIAHSNLNISYGPLNYIINSPTLHRWHHAKGPEAINKNLGVTFTLWDFLFGTALYPKQELYPTKGLGFPQSEKYNSLKNQLLLPFLKLFGKQPK